MKSIYSIKREDLEEYFNHAYYTGANKPINLCYTFKPAPRPAIGGITVSGTATSFGSNTDDVTIQLIKSGASEASYETVVKGKIASYSIEDVAPGTYTMKVMKKNHVAREYTVTVSTENVTQDVKLCLKGDANGSGTVDIEDAMLVFYHVAKKSYLGDEGLAACDTNADCTVDIEDAMTIFYFVAKKIDKI